MLRLVLLAVAVLSSQGTTVFRDDELRLAFDYPKTWTLTKKKSFTTLTIPIEGSADKARLEITRAVFRSDPEIWQTVQLDANKQLKREVVRQWQEEILGVPMLLTHIRYSVAGVPTSTLTGLLYTRTASKLLFRLTGPDSDFDRVQYDFETAIQTLRTIGDTALTPEDPTKPPVKADPVPTKIDLTPPRKVTFNESTKKTSPVLGPVTLELEVSTRKMLIRLPQGWTFDGVEGNRFVAHRAGLTGPVTVAVYSQADSDPPKGALFKQSNDSLNAFVKVAKRDDVQDRTTRSSMVENAVWRSGDGKEAKRFSLDATLSNDTHYALISYQSANDGDRRLLDELLSILSVAPAP